MLGDDDLGSAFVEVGDDGVAVEGLVAEQSTELNISKQWGDPHSVEAMAGLPVRATHNTASTNRRSLRPLCPGSLVLPWQSGSIFAH